MATIIRRENFRHKYYYVARIDGKIAAMERFHPYKRAEIFRFIRAKLESFRLRIDERKIVHVVERFDYRDKPRYRKNAMYQVEIRIGKKRIIARSPKDMATTSKKEAISYARDGAYARLARAYFGEDVDYDPRIGKNVLLKIKGKYHIREGWVTYHPAKT